MASGDEWLPVAGGREAMTFSKTRRRSLRRHVGVMCSIASQLWDGTVEFAASDVSHEGLWIDTPYPLELGDEVVLSFVPPGASYHDDVWAIAEVARVGLWDTNRVPWEAGMALSFTYFSALDRRFLEQSLQGRPPRLPRKRALAPLTHQPPPLPQREPAFDARRKSEFVSARESRLVSSRESMLVSARESRLVSSRESMLAMRTSLAPTARMARGPASTRARVSSPAGIGFADVPPVLDADLAFEFAPVSLGELLTAPRPPAAARYTAWGLA
jgi:hypothetical protein